MTTFETLGIEGRFCRALDDAGITQPTPIQEQAIPILLEGRDVLGLAQTGTGKTAAFTLPLLQNLLLEDAGPERRKVRALVLAPTRELAIQIYEAASNFAQHSKLRVAAIYGGVGANPQIKAVSGGIDILVATPGRLLDLMGQGYVDLSKLRALVLDEADRLLDMGFIHDIRRIVKECPKRRHTLLFSATMPQQVEKLANDILYQPTRIDVSPKEMTVKATDQYVVSVAKADKRNVLTHLLRNADMERAIVFTRTKYGADRVARQLVSAGINAAAIHGGKGQGARQRALASFADGDVWVLVATDIAARGIDVRGITHVVNFEIPNEPEAYVHRIGRTGRAGRTGVAWALMEPSEASDVRDIEKLIGMRLKPLKVVGFEPAAQPTPPRDAAPAEASGAASGVGKKRRRRPRKRKVAAQ